MKISVTMDFTTENLRKLEAILADNADVTITPTNEAPAPVEVPSSDSAKESEKIKITQTDIRAAAIALSKANKQDVLADIFNKFGGKKLSDFESRPEVYPELMKALVAAND